MSFQSMEPFKMVCPVCLKEAVFDDEQGEQSMCSNCKHHLPASEFEKVRNMLKALMIKYKISIKQLVEAEDVFYSMSNEDVSKLLQELNHNN